MLKKIIVVFSLVMLVFFAGCASKPEPKPVQPEPQPQTLADVPQFFLMPPTAEDALYGVGVAKMSSLDL